MKKSLALILGLTLLSQGCASQYARGKQSQRIKDFYFECGCIATGISSDADKEKAKEVALKEAQRNYFAECTRAHFPKVSEYGCGTLWTGDFECYAVARKPNCKK